MAVIYNTMTPVSIFAEGFLLLLMLRLLCKPRSVAPSIFAVSLIIGIIVYGTVLNLFINNQYSVIFLLLKTGMLLITTFLLYRDPPLFKSLSVAVTIFLHLTISNLSQFLCVLLLEAPHDLYIGFMLIRMISRIRFITILVSLGMQAITIALLHRFLRRLSEMKKTYQFVSTVILFPACLIVFLLLQMITWRSFQLSQTAVILAWIFITLCMIAILYVFVITSSLAEARLQNDLILTMNHSMSEGYHIIAAKNDELRKLSHDFRAHLMTIRELEPPDMAVYIDGLLKIPAAAAHLSNTGDRYVDAVINSKLDRMSALSIQFQHNARLPIALSISPSDTCAIISNQLDNAIDACEKIADPALRWINLSLDMQGDLLRFRCENSILPGSVKPDLSSTKSQDHHLHGFGISIIQTCAARYDGVLNNLVEDDRFISMVTVKNCRNH